MMKYDEINGKYRRKDMKHDEKPWRGAPETDEAALADGLQEGLSELPHSAERLRNEAVGARVEAAGPRPRWPSCAPATSR